MTSKLSPKPRGARKPETPPGTTPWRVRRSVGRTLYDCEGRLIGIVDTRDIALLVVEAVNGYFGTGVEPELLPRSLSLERGERKKGRR